MYDKSYRAIDIGNIPLGYSSTPFIWDKQGNKYNMCIYSGQCVVHELPDGSISPGFVLVFAQTY